MSQTLKTNRGKILRDHLTGSLKPLTPGPATPDSFGRVLRRQVVHSEQCAQGVLQAAQLKANEIVADARARAEEQIIVQQARARADALASVVAEAVALRSKRAELSKAASHESIRLARMLAERILGEELRLAPERIQALAMKVLEEARGTTRAVLYAHPEDAARLEVSLLAEANLVEHLELESDPQLSRGDLRVETELGVIDGNIAGQLSYLTKRLSQLVR